MSKDLSTIEIGPYRPGDEGEILRVFNQVFRVERSLDTWNWEYRDNPEGIHVFLGRFPDGQVVSQFAGIPRRIKVREGLACFAEIVDSLTDPEYRKGLKKPGLFATTCYRFVDHFGRPDREVVMYGLPNPPAFRVGSLLLGYSHLYDVEYLTCEPGSDTAAHPPSVEVIDSVPDDVDGLWDRIRGRYDVATVRDRRYLQWRYGDRPDAEYELLSLRDDTADLFGFVVLRHRWLDDAVTALADWVVDRDHPRAPEAVQAVLAAARAAGTARIRAVFRPGSPEWNGLAAVGWVPEASRFRFVARTYDAERVPLAWLKDAWFITLGDFDIV